MKLRDLVGEKPVVKVVCIRDCTPRPPADLPREVPKVDQREAAAALVDHPGHPYLFPDDGNYPFTEKVLPSALAKVDLIRDRASALGWSEGRLYQNRGRFRFPFGGGYGLVCFVGDDKRIGEVTNQHIEIVVGSPPRESRLQFYNPDADRPWLSRVPINCSEGPFPS